MFVFWYKVVSKALVYLLKWWEFRYTFSHDSTTGTLNKALNTLSGLGVQWLTLYCGASQDGIYEVYIWQFMYCSPVNKNKPDTFYSLKGIYIVIVFVIGRITYTTFQCKKIHSGFIRVHFRYQ